jgi:hypothetical protein
MAQILSPRFVTSGLSRFYDAANDRSRTRNIFRSYGNVGEGSGADNGVTFEVNGTGTFIRMGWGQTFGTYKIQPQDVVYKYNLSSTGGCHYHGNDVTVVAGTYASFYFDFYVSPGAASYPLTNYLANFEGVGGGSVGAPNSSTGVWQRTGFTAGPMNAGNLRMLLYPGACGGDLATSGYVLYKNPIVVLSTSPIGDIIGPNNSTYYTSTNALTTVNDIVGAQNGTLVNGVKTDGLGFVFDGSDDYITIPNIYMGNGNVPWTINAWVRTTTTVNSLGAGSVISNSSGGPVYSMLGVNAGRIVYWTYQNDAWAQKLGNATVNDGVWHQLTWVNNSNSTMSMYVDGVLDASVANSTSGNNNPLDRIGGSWSAQFDGRISQLAIYNSKALTAAEVYQNFDALRKRFGR